MEQNEKIGKYTVQSQIRLGGRTIAFGVNEAEEYPYMVTYVREQSGFFQTEEGTAYQSYVDAMEDLQGRIQTQLAVIRQEMRQAPTLEAFPSDKMLPLSGNCTGKVLCLKPSVLAPEYRYASHQLIYAERGSGCQETGGRSIHTFNLHDGSSSTWYRQDFIGEVPVENLPEWAQEGLAKIPERIRQRNEKLNHKHREEK